MSAGLGLDKAERLKTKREQEAEAAIPQPLDPPFPFQAQPFDVEFFVFGRDLEPSAHAGK